MDRSTRFGIRTCVPLNARSHKYLQKIIASLPQQKNSEILLSPTTLYTNPQLESCCSLPNTYRDMSIPEMYSHFLEKSLENTLSSLFNFYVQCISTSGGKNCICIGYENNIVSVLQSHAQCAARRFFALEFFCKQFI